MKKVQLFLVMLLVSCLTAAAQSLTITGKVTYADDGSPVIGATVKIKGTTNAVPTDVNGAYKITIPASAQKVLEVSFVGLKTVEVSVPQSGNYDVKMDSDATALEEVIVTSSYGVAQKGTFTGAAAVVKGDRLQMPTSSFDKALQGNASGVLSVSNSGQPGAGQSVVIRGVGSINAGTQPLYIIDGQPISTESKGNMTQTSTSSLSGDNLNPLSSLNPNDIASMTVLKDASATAIYGSRAANGVILITTKRGSSGKTQFNLKLSTGFSNRTNTNVRPMNREEYIDYLNIARPNGGYKDGITDVNGQKVNSFIANTFNVRMPDKGFYDYKWEQQAYDDNAPMTTADFSVSGGNEKTKFFVSLSYLDQKGIVKKTNMTRYAARVNVDHKVSDKIKFGTNIALSYNDQQSPMTTSSYYVNPVFAAYLYAPLDPATIEKGSWLWDSKKDTYTPYDPENGINIDNLKTYANANFVANREYDEFSSKTARAIMGANIQYDIIPGLILKGSAGMDWYYLTESDWKDPRPRGNSASYGFGQRDVSVGQNRQWNENVTLSYVKDFGKNNINVMVGQEVQAEDYNLVEGITVNFPGTQFHELSSGAVNSAVAGYGSGAALASFFANANYNYDSRYYVSASFRADGSSRLSVDKRWAQFWSVGGSWKISQESFAKDWDWLSSATLRASYGTTGNSSGIGKYAAQGLYASGANYNGSPGTSPYQIANKELGWEKSATFNVGLDFSFLQGRLGGSVEYYDRQTKDLLLSVPLSYTSGFSTIMSNLGSMSNRGFEITLNGSPVVANNFRWDLDFNITFNKNRVTSLAGNRPLIGTQFGGSYIAEGMDVQTLYSYSWAGVNPASGAPMYYDKNGELINALTSSDDRMVQGSAAPKFFGGLTSKFSFYGVDISLLFYYTYGNKIMDSSWGMQTHMGARSLYNMNHYGATESWRKEGDQAAFPVPLYGYSTAVYNTTNSRMIFDGSYIRLRDVTVGYNLPKKWMKAIGFNNVRVFAQGSNLFTLTTFPDADPEVGRTGYYYLGYPNARTITFGLDLKF